MFLRRWHKALLCTPIALATALLGYPENLTTELDGLQLGDRASAAGKARKSAGRARSAGRKSPARGGSKAKKPSAGKAAASKGSAGGSSGRKPVRHRRLADPGANHSPAPSGNPSRNEMLTPVEPERAGPVPTESRNLAPRRVAQVSAEDAPLSETERELAESLNLVVTPRGPYESWVVQLQNAGDKPARISSDVRLLWFEATVPGKRKPVVCELPGGMRPNAAYSEERVELQPRQELSFNIDPRFFCFETEDTTLLVPGTFLKPHYGWRTKTQKTWQKGKPKEVRLAQSAPFVAVSPSGPDGMKELIGPGIALDDRFAEWSKTRITQEDKLPLPPDAGLLEEEEGSAHTSVAPTGTPTSGHAETPAGLELIMVKGSDAASATDISVIVAVRNRGTEAQRVHLRADQLTFIVWGPDGQQQCSPPFAYRAPDRQGLTTLAPGKRISMTVRLNEFCPSGTFGRPGFYYISADLPVLDNHDDGGRPLPRAEGEPASNPRVLEASFGRPLRVRSGDVRFNYWDVATALEPEPVETADDEPAASAPAGAKGGAAKPPLRPTATPTLSSARPSPVSGG